MCVFSLTNKEHRYTHTHAYVESLIVRFLKKLFFYFFGKKLKNNRKMKLKVKYTFCLHALLVVSSAIVFSFLLFNNKLSLPLLIYN